MRMYRWVKLGVSSATVEATLSVGGVAHAATETDVARTRRRQRQRWEGGDNADIQLPLE